MLHSALLQRGSLVAARQLKQQKLQIHSSIQLAQNQSTCRKVKSFTATEDVQQTDEAAPAETKVAEEEQVEVPFPNLSEEMRAKMVQYSDDMNQRVEEFKAAVILQKEKERDEEFQKNKKKMKRKTNQRKYQPIVHEAIKVVGLDPTEGVTWLIKQMELFDEEKEVKVDFITSLQPGMADERIRGTITLPHSVGGDTTICVVTNSARVDEAKEAGADFAGDLDMLEKLKGGFCDFDKLICTPDMMAKIAPLGRQLGPKGLMPSPKTGTVTDDLAGSITSYKKGKAEYKLEKNQGVQFVVGNTSMNKEQILDNMCAGLQAMDSSKPEKVPELVDVMVEVVMQVEDGLAIPVAFEGLSEVAAQRGFPLLERKAEKLDNFSGLTGYEVFKEMGLA